MLFKFVNFRAIMKAPRCADDVEEPKLTAEELDEDGGEMDDGGDGMCVLRMEE